MCNKIFNSIITLLLSSAIIACSHSDDIIPEIIPSENHPQIYSVSVEGIEAVQKDSTTFFVKLPYGTDTKTLNVTFETNSALKMDDTDSIETIDLSNPVIITASLNGENKDYTIIAHYSNLPVVYINTSAAVENKTDWVKGCTLQITNANEFDGIYTTSIKGRGNSTWNFPKKPYAIKLDEKSEILGMPKHKRWCLLANWMDRTNIRNAVAFKVSSIFSGLEWTPSGEFVDLVYNGEFMGNYYLCEQIKIDKNRLSIDELKPSDIDETSISGGYLLEFDTHFDEEFKFKTDILDLPVNLKSPDENVPAQQMTYIKNYINTVENKLNAHAPYSEIETLIDIDSYVDWWLMNELVCLWEPNHPKSSYMYKKREGKLFAGPAWDFDWGTFTEDTNWRNKNSLWYRYLFTYKEFTDKVKERWTSHTQALISISEYIDYISNLIEASSIYDCIIWPLDERDINHDEWLPYKESIALLKKNYQSRLKWMEENIPNL